MHRTLSFFKIQECESWQCSQLKEPERKREGYKDMSHCFDFVLLQLKEINSVIISVQKEAIPDIIFFLCPPLKEEI